jgi:hypothetical protein
MTGVDGTRCTVEEEDKETRGNRNKNPIHTKHRHKERQDDENVPHDQGRERQ